MGRPKKTTNMFKSHSLDPYSNLERPKYVSRGLPVHHPNRSYLFTDRLMMNLMELSAWGYNRATPFLALQVRGVSNLRQWNVFMIPAGLWHENDCAGEDHQQLWTTDPSSRKRGCYIWTSITASIQLENKITVSWVSRVLSPRRTDWR
jgi:hypothetical protein